MSERNSSTLVSSDKPAKLTRTSLSSHTLRTEQHRTVRGDVLFRPIEGSQRSDETLAGSKSSRMARPLLAENIRGVLPNADHLQ